jgi:hypothetical protein
MEPPAAAVAAGVVAGEAAGVAAAEADGLAAAEGIGEEDGGAEVGLGAAVGGTGVTGAADTGGAVDGGTEAGACVAAVDPQAAARRPMTTRVDSAARPRSGGCIQMASGSRR